MVREHRIFLSAFGVFLLAGIYAMWYVPHGDEVLFFGAYRSTFWDVLFKTTTLLGEGYPFVLAGAVLWRIRRKYPWDITLLGFCISIVSYLTKTGCFFKKCRKIGFARAGRRGSCTRGQHQLPLRAYHGGIWIIHLPGLIDAGKRLAVFVLAVFSRNGRHIPDLSGSTFPAGCVGRRFYWGCHCLFFCLFPKESFTNFYTQTIKHLKPHATIGVDKALV
jgi:hypothetical protein